jgi:hypothetical protein
MNTTRAEEITMREDYGNINLDSGGDDGFGDVPGMEVDGEESHTELRGVSGNLTVDQVNSNKINNKLNENVKYPIIYKGQNQIVS